MRLGWPLSCVLVMVCQPSSLREAFGNLSAMLRYTVGRRFVHAHCISSNAFDGSGRRVHGCGLDRPQPFRWQSLDAGTDTHFQSRSSLIRMSNYDKSCCCLLPSWLGAALAASTVLRRLAVHYCLRWNSLQRARLQSSTLCVDGESQNRKVHHERSGTARKSCDCVSNPKP